MSDAEASGGKASGAQASDAKANGAKASDAEASGGSAQLGALRLFIGLRIGLAGATAIGDVAAGLRRLASKRGIVNRLHSASIF